MLYLLDENVRTVKWNGIPLHEASSAIVKEETNGDFYLTVHYPITDSGIYQLIKEDMLIKAPVPVLGAQLFRIKKPIENDDSLGITAYHVTDDIMQRSITPVNVVGQGCAMALSQMVQNAKTGLGDFSFTSDIMDSRTFNTTETETLYSVLMDGKHSIVGTWEGELVRDNFALSIKRSRGANRGVVITTHKNLKSYQRTKNSQGVVTRIHARSTFKPDGAEDEVTLRVTVDSPLINSYPYINEKEYENNNVKTVEELKKWAEAKFKNDGIDKVSDAIEIEAYELDGQVVHLGDTVNLKSRKHNVDVYKKAIAYEYNALTEEYISITFDDKAGVGGSRVSSGLSNAADAILGASATAQNVAVERAVKNANQAFDAEFEKRVEAINDGIEQVKAKATEYADRLNQAVTSKVQEDNQLVIANKAEQDKQYKETLAKAGASSDLAKQAQNLATQVRDDLNKVKQTATQAQSQVNSQIDQVKKDVGAIRNQQTAYEQTNTQNLARITGQLGDKASKSEVEQTADGIREELASLSVGGRNLALGTSKEWSTPFTNFSGNPNIWSPLYKVLTDGLQVGDTLRSKIILKYTDVRPATGKTATVGLQGNGNVTGWTDGAYNGSPAKTLNGSGEITFEHSFKITENHLKNAYWNWMFRTDFIASGSLQWRLAKVESGSVFTNWSPAPEDAEGLITEAKATFERTAQGLRTDLTAVQSYVNADGTRAEALRTYSREETARQLTAERKVIEAGYVAKAQHTEDVRGLTNRFEELKTSSETNLAEYKQSVEGRFTTISQQIAGKASQTDFQRVQETSRLYERIIGSNEDDISNKVARMALTNQLFQVEVGKYANVGGPNMLRNSRADDGLKYWTEADGRLSFTAHTFYFNGQKRIFELRPGAVVKSPRFIVKRGGEYMLNMLGFDANSKSFKIYFCKRKKGAIPEYQEKQVVFVSTGSPAFSSSQVVKKSFKFNVEDFDEGFLQFEYEKQDLNRWGGLFMTELDFYEGMTDRLWQPAPEDATLETDKTLEATQTKMTQLAGSWAVQNINSAGDLISGLNLGANGVNRLDGRLTHITGQTLIDNAVIKSAMIDKLKTANFESGSVTTQILASGAVTADKLVVDQAFFDKLSANYAYLRQLFSKDAFITSVQSVTMSASKIVGGVLAATNGAMQINLTNGQIHYYTDQAAMKRILSGYPTQFVKFATGNVNGTTAAGVTVVGSNRYGTESSNDGGFVGMRAWNGNGVDSLDLVGDDISLASSAYENADGWTVTTTGKLQIKPKRQQDRRNSTLEIGDIWLYLQNDGKYYSSIHDILKNIYENLRLLHKHTTTRSDYSYSLRDI